MNYDEDLIILWENYIQYTLLNEKRLTLPATMRALA